jgi:hypothetical protein
MHHGLVIAHLFKSEFDVDMDTMIREPATTTQGFIRRGPWSMPRGTGSNTSSR